MDADVIVIGLGAVGSCATMQLAEAGHRVIGLEKGPRINPRAAYAGESRLFRVAYHEGPEYVAALLYSRSQWMRLNRQSGQTVFRGSGVVSVAAADAPQIAGVLASVEENGLPHSVLDAAELRASYPQFRDIGDDEIGVVDDLGGFVRSEPAVAAFQRAALAAGAEIRDRTEVVGVDETASGVRVRTADGELTASRVIVSAGVWATALVPALADLVEVRPIPLAWYLAERPADFAPDRFPGFIRDSGGHHVYGFPSLDGATVKIGAALQPGPLASPDELPDAVAPELLAASAQAVGRLIDGLVPSPVRSSLHMDLYTPNKVPVIDSASARIVVAGAFSGHGFKLTPAWARLACDLALGEEPALDLAPYRLAR